MATVATDGSKIEEEYASQRPVYDAFTENAYELLSKLLKDAGNRATGERQ